MSPKVGWIFCLFWGMIFLFMGNSLAISAEYFVSPVGSDTNSGSLSSPFKTVLKGVSVLQTGDVLTVEEGTYTEPIDEPVGLDNSLAKDWNNTITIRARPGKIVTLRPSSGNRVFTFQRPQQSYVIVDGFIIDAINVAIDAIKITRVDSQFCHHVWIRNCVIKNAPDQGILTTQESATSGGGGNRLTNLDVFDNGFNCSLNSAKYCHGFYISSDNNLIEDSRVHDNAGWGIHVYSGSYEIKNNVVKNNLVYRNGSHGVNGNLGLSDPTSGIGYPGIGLYSGPGQEAYGNIVWGNSNGIVLRYGGENSLAHNNTVYRNKSPNGVGFPIDVAGINTNDSISTDGIYNNTYVDEDSPPPEDSQPPTVPSNPPSDSPAQNVASSLLFDKLISINNVISGNKKEIQFDFTLSTPAHVVASLYTSRGDLLEELKNETLSSGQLSSIIWNGTLKSGKPVSSGVYILKVKLGDREEMKKIVVVK